MSLQKPTTLSWIALNDAIHKIVSFDCTETGADDNGKLYKVCVVVKSYTNDTKNYEIKQHSYYLEDLKESELNLGLYYAKLKEEEDFKDATDA